MIPVSKRGGEAGCGRCVFAVNFRSDTVRCFSVVIVSISLSLSLSAGLSVFTVEIVGITVSVLNDVE